MLQRFTSRVLLKEEQPKRTTKSVARGKRWPECTMQTSKSPRISVAPIFLRGVGRRSLAEYREEDEMSPQSAKAEKSVNQINLLGRLGRDAELRGTVEHPVVVFTMATNFLYTKQDGEKVIHTDWHRVSVFRPGLRENIATYLRKGDRVFVTGNMRYDEYVDSNNKPQRSATVIAADIVNLTKRYLEEQG